MPTRSASTDALWDREIARATVLHLNTADVATMLRESPDHVAFELPSANGTIILDLERVSILMDDFTVVQASTNGIVEAPQGLHYRGMQRDVPGSLASISIFGNEVMGLISSDDGDLVLGKIDGASNGEHVLYRTADLRDNSGPSCSTMDDGPEYTADQLQPGSTKTVKCVRLYWETTYAIFQDKDSVAGVVSYVTGLFNQSATLYANDGISVMLQQVFVWNVPSPYTGTSTSDLLDQFGDYRTSFNGDLAHLLGYAGGGGVAYVNQLCNSQSRFKMAYSAIDDWYSNVPTFSWSIEVVTHEQGHLLGSKHTHACALNGNNTRIDGCGPAAGYNEGTCAAASVPSSSVGGTIMSYCHLVSAGIKFSNGFGPQPTALIVNNINNASCLTACSPPPTCGTPAGLSAGSITSTSAVLSWGAVSGATSYTLQWKPTSSGIFNTVTGLATTSYTLSGLASNTAHHFQVLAVCASGSSTYSTLTAFATAAGTCADAYEPNNTNGTALVIPANSTTSASIGVNGDLDWFRFSNTTAQRNIKVTLTNLAANYQLRLYRSNTQLATSLNSGTTSEQIIYNTSTVGTNYKVKVNGATGAFSASQCYVLTVQISSTPFTTQALEGGGDMEVIESEEAVSIHPNPTSDAVNVVLPPSDMASTVDVLDATGRMVGSLNTDAVDVRTNLVFDMSDKPEGIYLVRVTRGSETTVQRLVVAR
ncbi:MAG: M12 family metallo-peptidase [Flavobacteriales bacterium]